MTTTLITGATRGVGLELARRLAAAGQDVWVGARTVDEAVEVLVTMATIGPDGPTGTFVGNDGPLPW